MLGPFNTTNREVACGNKAKLGVVKVKAISTSLSIGVNSTGGEAARVKVSVTDTDPGIAAKAWWKKSTWGYPLLTLQNRRGEGK